MRHLKGIVLGFSLILSSMFVLTGCNTVEGTAEGAGKDIKAVSNAITPEPQHKKVHKHKHVKKKAAATSTTDTNAATGTTTDQSATTTTTETK